MAIGDFIEKVAVQPAVLWRYIGSDGFGGGIYEPPVEITCRWTDNDFSTKDQQGEEFSSRAELLLPDSIGDVKMKDFVYLGQIEEINNEPNPLNIDKAYEVKRVTRVPLLFSTDEFVRKAFV